jgi:hypothetical protein
LRPAASGSVGDAAQQPPQAQQKPNKHSNMSSRRRIRFPYPPKGVAFRATRATETSSRRFGRNSHSTFSRLADQRPTSHPQQHRLPQLSSTLPRHISPRLPASIPRPAI